MSTLTDAQSLIKFIDGFSELTDVILDKIPRFDNHPGLKTNAFQGEIELAVYRRITALKEVFDFEGDEALATHLHDEEPEIGFVVRKAVRFVRKLVRERWEWKLDRDVKALNREVIARESRLAELEDQIGKAGEVLRRALYEAERQHVARGGHWATIGENNAETTKAEWQARENLLVEQLKLETEPLIGDRRASLADYIIDEMRGIRDELLSHRPLTARPEVLSSAVTEWEARYTACKAKMPRAEQTTLDLIVKLLQETNMRHTQKKIFERLPQVSESVAKRVLSTATTAALLDKNPKATPPGYGLPFWPATGA